MRNANFSDDEQLFNAVKEKIEKEFLEPLSYDELAKHFLISRKALEKGFVHRFGQTIHHFLEQLRVHYACNLMRTEPGKIVQDVGYEAGFNDPSTFYRAFSRVVGGTPGRWKKNNNSGNGPG